MDTTSTKKNIYHLFQIWSELSKLILIPINWFADVHWVRMELKWHTKNKIKKIVNTTWNNLILELQRMSPNFKNSLKIRLKMRQTKRLEVYLCVCPGVYVSSGVHEHSGTKLVWHAYSNQHSVQSVRDLGHRDCCRFQNCAATLPIAPQWTRCELVWFSSSTNLHHQNSYRLKWLKN